MLTAEYAKDWILDLPDTEHPTGLFMKLWVSAVSTVPFLFSTT